MNKNYAYLTENDNHETIMHLNPSKEIAERSMEVGNIVETDIPENGGHAVVFYDGKEQAIIVYSDTEMTLDAADKKAFIKNADKVLPQLAELYRKCRG